MDFVRDPDGLASKQKQEALRPSSFFMPYARMDYGLRP